MHQLVRRAALAMTLPIAVGAPVVLLAQPAHASASNLTLTLSTAAPVYGQVMTATALATDGSNVTTDGCVQFSVSEDNHEGGMSATVPVDATGHATTPFFKDSETGLPLDVNTLPDRWHVNATYLPDCVTPLSVFAPPKAFDIAKAGSSIAVVPTATTLSADLGGKYPGAAVETSARPDGGAVQFTVDGAAVGTSPAVNGTATISYVLPAGSHTVTASYAGDSRYLPSSAAESKTRKDPVLEANLLSFFPRTKSGWYPDEVDIWFTCRPQGSELTAECPADVILKKSGKGQSVTRTITALDGGSATVTVSGINIDRVKPKITVTGRTCKATDKLSGVKGQCRMKIVDGTYTATAKDKAGNVAVKRGKVG